MLTSRTRWVKGELRIKCAHCRHEKPAGHWLAAHSVEVDRGDITFTCTQPKCGKRSTVGKIPRP